MKLRRSIRRFVKRHPKLTMHLAIITVLLVVHFAVVGSKTKSIRDNYELRISEYEELIVEKDHAIEVLQSSIDNIYDEINSNEEAMRLEAEYISKVVYGLAKYHSPKVHRYIVWCVINRVESSKYPNTVKEVCQQDKQWMGYSDNNPVDEDIFNTVYNEVLSWHNGGERLLNSDYLFIQWSSSKIMFKTTYKDTSDTHYVVVD